MAAATRRPATAPAALAQAKPAQRPAGRTSAPRPFGAMAGCPPARFERRQPAGRQPAARAGRAEAGAAAKPLAAHAAAGSGPRPAGSGQRPHPAAGPANPTALAATAGRLAIAAAGRVATPVAALAQPLGRPERRSLEPGPPRACQRELAGPGPALADAREDPTRPPAPPSAAVAVRRPVAGRAGAAGMAGAALEHPPGSGFAQSTLAAQGPGLDPESRAGLAVGSPKRGAAAYRRCAGALGSGPSCA